MHVLGPRPVYRYRCGVAARRAALSAARHRCYCRSRRWLCTRIMRPRCCPTGAGTPSCCDRRCSCYFVTSRPGWRLCRRPRCGLPTPPALSPPLRTPTLRGRRRALRGPPCRLSTWPASSLTSCSTTASCCPPRRCAASPPPGPPPACREALPREARRREGAGVSVPSRSGAHGAVWAPRH